MVERYEIEKSMARMEALRRQKVIALTKAVRHRMYRVRNEQIAEALLRETLQMRARPREMRRDI
jgi:anti-sigma28 factor (negative regulator of flagellin synthesis)